MDKMIYVTLEIYAAIFVATMYACASALGKSAGELRYIKALLLSSFFAIVSDSLSWYFLGDTQHLTAFYVALILSYATMYLTEFCFHIYVVSFLDCKASLRKRLQIVPGIYGVVISAIWALSLKTGWYYYFDEAGIIQYTEIHWLSQYLSLAIIIMDIYILIIDRKKIGIKNARILSTYILVPILCQSIQFLINNVSLTYLSLPLGLFLIFVMTCLEQKKNLAEHQLTIQKNQNSLMLSQIQPHFLYNTISSIMVLCQTSPDDAVDALGYFSDYLRANLDSIGGESTTSFSTELNHIETYLKLEKLRFKEKLNIQFEIGPSEFFVPTLSIQPLVENAVKHGVTKKKEGGTVKLVTYEDNNNYYVEIQDDGIGFNPTETKPDDGRSHVGLVNVSNRLQLCCSGSLAIESRPNEGTKAVVVIPKETKC